RAAISGTVFNDANGNGVRDFRESGMAGLTVQLLDDSGQVIASTVTDRMGRYRFDIFNGIEGPGTYSVQVVIPAGDSLTTAEPTPMQITKGDTFFNGVNFGVKVGKTAVASTAVATTASPTAAPVSSIWGTDLGLDSTFLANGLSDPSSLKG